MKISMLINGEQTQARNGATFERRNPLDGSVATRRTRGNRGRRRRGRRGCR